MNVEKIAEQIINQTTDDLLQMNASDMGLSTEVNAKNHALNVHFKAGFPTHLLEKNYLGPLEDNLSQALPGITLNITMESFIKAHQTQLAGKALRGVKNTIAIASGKGGVGKSTVAINLATSLAKQGARVGILDADIYGPSIPLMLGKTDDVKVQGERYLPVQAHGVSAMSIAYLTDPDQALIWRGPMLAKSLLQMLDITLWDELDYLFIDLPPGTGDIQLSLVQKIPLTAAIVVTTPQNVATLDAQKAIAMFNKTGIHVLGLIENMSLHHCSHCGHEEPVFGQGGAAVLSQKHHIPLLGALPLDSKIREDGDRGYPTGSQIDNPLSASFDKAALTAAIHLSKRAVNYAGKFPDIVLE